MVLSLVISILACVFFVFYPYVIYPCALRFLSTSDLKKNYGNQIKPTLLFCAYNEANVIAEKIQNVRRLKDKYPDLEVLAFDDGSSDGTADLLASHPNLLTLVRGCGRNGKAHGMKKLANLATGNILVFTDANVLLHEDAIENLGGWYADERVGGVCGKLEYLGDGDSATAEVGGRYWRLEESIKLQESRTGNVMGADGSIFSIRKQLYPEFPDTVLDDLTVSMAVVFAGKRLIKVDDVVAYERLVSLRKEEFSRKIRIAARSFHTHLFLREQLSSMSRIDKFKYTSRKFIRWFGGLFLLAGVFLTCVLSFIFAPLLGVIVSAAFMLLTGIILKVQSGPLGAFSEIVLALMATLTGVFRAMRGQTVVTWSPAKSR